MGFVNRTGYQGFVTEDKGENSSTKFVIENLAGHTGSNTLYVKIDGTVDVNDGNILTGSFAGTFSGVSNSIRYEFHDHSGSQTIPQSPAYVVLSCNSLNDFVAGGLSLWNSSSNKLEPTSLNSVYSIRLTGKTGPTDGGGNGIIHIDFALSGATPPNFVQDYNRQKQSTEVNTRSNSSHTDILVNYTFFTDNALLLSGAQFYATTTIVGGITLNSCSLFIKEG